MGVVSRINIILRVVSRLTSLSSGGVKTYLTEFRVMSRLTEFRVVSRINSILRVVSGLTSLISLRAVSAPREKLVPGTLLLMVHGMTHMGMQKAGY